MSRNGQCSSRGLTALCTLPRLDEHFVRTPADLAISEQNEALNHVLEARVVAQGVSEGPLSYPVTER